MLHNCRHSARLTRCGLPCVEVQPAVRVAGVALGLLGLVIFRQALLTSSHTRSRCIWRLISCYIVRRASSMRASVCHQQCPVHAAFAIIGQATRLQFCLQTSDWLSCRYHGRHFTFVPSPWPATLAAASGPRSPPDLRMEPHNTYQAKTPTTIPSPERSTTGIRSLRCRRRRSNESGRSGRSDSNGSHSSKALFP